MIRIERGPGTLTVLSRYSRPQAIGVLAVALVGLAAWAARGLPVLAAALLVAAALVVTVGGRATRAVLGAGRVRVSAPVPLGRPLERSLGTFRAVRVETLADARRRTAERRARSYRDRVGRDLPGWLRPADQPGGHEHLRRLVLDGPGEEPLALTAWLADAELEGARVEVERVLGA